MGKRQKIAKGFESDDLIVDFNTHACPCPTPNHEIKDLYRALVLGVRDYFHKQGFKKALLGLSGGIDSALVACIAKEALGKENVLAIALPSRYSSEGSVKDASRLAENLGIELKEVSIDPLFQHYLDVLRPLFQGKLKDLSEQNLQARVREMILMAFCNEMNALLLNTSNKSEMAMGYSTLYGDMAGGLGVLQDVTKSRVYLLAELVNAKQTIIPQEILDKVPSAELKVNQTDFDTLPPYEILDSIIEKYVEEGWSVEEIAEKKGFSPEVVSDVIHKIHLAEYKRRQAPIGIRITMKAFSKGRLVPIVQGWK